MLSAVTPIGNTFDRTPTISWSADAGAVSYELWVLQLGENQGQVLLKSGLTTTQYTILPADHLIPQSHRVWVRSFNSAGTPSGWSTPMDFVVTTERPVFLSPEESSLDTIISSTSPTLTWGAVVGATSYKLQVDEVSATGATSVFSDSAVMQTARIVPGLVSGKYYRAWVTAQGNNNSESGISVPVEFKIQAPATGLAITSPANSSSIFDRNPTFEWNSVSGAVSYNVWLNQSSDGVNWTVVKQRSGVFGTSWSATAAEIAPLSQLNLQFHRFWVQSVDVNGTTSPWSPVSQFSVTSDKPTITGPVPAGSPPAISTQSPVLQWTPVGGAVRYAVQVDNITTNTSSVIDRTDISGNSLQLTGLAFGNLYRAWVRGISNDGTLTANSTGYDLNIGSAHGIPGVRSAYCARKQGNYRVDCGMRSLTVGKANNALLKVADHVWLKRIDRSVMICCAPS